MFPYGRAYAARTMNFCRMLKSAGCEVDVLADYISDRSMLTGKKTGSYEGVGIYLTTAHAAPDRTFLDKLTVPARMPSALKKYLKNHTPDCVITGSAFDRFGAIARILRNKGIPLILESCEWFDTYNWSRGRLDPRYHLFRHFWETAPRKVNGVIAISRLIYERYSRLVPNTIRIPGLADPESIKTKTYVPHEKISLAFIGEIVCNKDNVADIINAIEDAGLCAKFEFHIFGPSESDICAQLGKNSLPDFVKAHGFVKQDKLAGLLEKADYGIIIRPDRRSSHAGFPTKLVEYMSAGLPVIGNITGDIGLYLKDGENGYIVDTGSPDSIKTH